MGVLGIDHDLGMQLLRLERSDPSNSATSAPNRLLVLQQQHALR
jgi:hypothetical protein